MADEIIPFPETALPAPEPKTLQPSFLSPAKEVICPDPDCSTCKGSGIVFEDGGEANECSCMLIKRVRQYLTPVYVDAKWKKEMKADKMEGNNYIMSGTKAEYKAIVKSFLLNTGMKYQHCTVFGNSLFQYYFAGSTSPEWKSLCDDFPFVILYLGDDPPNKLYGQVFINFMEKRAMRKLPTWIYSSRLMKSEGFIQKYSLEFVEYLKKEIDEKRMFLATLDITDLPDPTAKAIPG